MTRAALQEELLIDKQLTAKEHNQRASLIRNGLMVVAFTTLEDFIRNRIAELLVHLSRTIVHFEDLPKELQHAATMEAARAAHSRALMLMRSGEDPLSLIQQAAGEIASTGQGALQISPYSFGYKGSNLSSGEIAEILRCLQVADAWNEMSNIASRCGFGSLPLKAQFDQGAQNRHSAAHSTSTNIQPVDLENFCKQALAIASSFDILASRAVRLIKEGVGDILVAKIKLSSHVSLRFIDTQAGKYAEKNEGSHRAFRVHDDLKSAWRETVGRARVDHRPIIQRDAAKFPVDWMVTDF
ncbi:hypothetical protein IOD16_10485 [Saccharothrix sp. 6-C]|uniref:HEPN domain-containing protein n=1 Tax=Saccharothrix sp. 6-C TaxID=2781735 RepID=UPI001917627B|nr:HEPN domain-containing protein [Saccharothrix sp. 6-C]QQQ78820.1 hypothetical protein IOD16_10485 [Saccharothrix sp. 6-C]